MKPLIIIGTKIMEKLLNMIGRDLFYLEIALKLNKNIMSYFKLPKITIFITGTTGKTSISGILTSMYKSNGYKVANNSKGSNLEWGVLTCLIANSNPFGKIKLMF